MDYALDTETLAFETDAVIVNIGIVAFDRRKVETFPELLARGALITVDRITQEKVGRRSTDKVMKWWEALPAEARAQLDVKGHHPAQVSHMLSEFFNKTGGDEKRSRWYCRGPHFDVAKLEDLFWQFNVRCPWHYRKPRCSRTALDEMGIEDHIRIKRPDYMIPHNAMHDAAFEAYMMQRATNGIPMVIADEKS